MADIVLKDKNGADVIYNNIHTISIPNANLLGYETFGEYTIITLDAVAGVFAHPWFSSPYVPNGLFIIERDGSELGGIMSGLYVDGSALGMPNGFLSCIGWSSDEDRTAWYSARFKNFSGEEYVETTANATLVCDTDARTITITHFENDGIDLTQYIPYASFKLWVMAPALFGSQ